MKIKVGRHRFWVVTSSDDDHYLDALLGGLRNWESDSLAVWSELCSKGGTVIDVGAYAGVYTALAVAAGAERVVAYEPNPVMFARLNATIEANQIEPQVVLRQIALSDVTGNFSLMVLQGREGTSGAHLETAISDPSYSWVRGGTVVSRKFVDEAAELGVKEISAIKIDVEGLETHVLRGAASLLARDRPPILLECLTEESLKSARDLLTRWGYGSVVMPESQRAGAPGAEGFRPGNFLFSRDTLKFSAGRVIGQALKE